MTSPFPFHQTVDLPAAGQLAMQLTASPVVTYRADRDALIHAMATVFGGKTVPSLGVTNQLTVVAANVIARREDGLPSEQRMAPADFIREFDGVFVALMLLQPVMLATGTDSTAVTASPAARRAAATPRVTPAP